MTRYTLSPVGGSWTSPAVVLEAHEAATLSKTFSFLGDSIGQENDITVQEIPYEGAGVGCQVWSAGVALSQFLWGSRAGGKGCLKDFECLELGAGVGLPGLAAAQLLEPASVTLTDSRSKLIESLAGRMNQLPPPRRADVKFSAAELNWQHVYQDSSARSSLPPPVDRVFGSDVIYYYPDVKPVAHTIAKLLKPGGEAFIFGPKKRVILKDFVAQLRSDNRFEKVEVGEFDFLVERLPEARVGELLAPDSSTGQGSKRGTSTKGRDKSTGKKISAEALAGLATCEASAYCLGDGAVELTTGGGRKDFQVSEEDVVFQDSTGLWVDAAKWQSRGDVSPCQKMLCIYATRKEGNTPSSRSHFETQLE